MFTKYDVLNRVVMTGIYDHGTNISRDSMQTVVNNNMADRADFYETYDGVSSADFGYTNQSFPILGANDEILTVTYYDNYHFDQYNILDYIRTYNSNDFLVSEISYAVKGQVTGTKVRVLGTDDFLTTVILYDDKYRVLRTYTENYLGGDDLFLNKIDYIGNMLKTKQVHVKQSGCVPMIINQRFVYDHALRLDSVFHEMDGNGEICMAVMEYNELGQLVKKKLNENANGSFLQEIDYEYNIRGWTTRINDPDNLEIAGEPKDMFAMELLYNSVIPEVNNAGDEQYNGNIAAVKWNTPEFGVKAYGYGYDNINRLERAKFAAGTALNTDVDKYSVENISYDANGNILTLGRHNTAAGFIDNLTMTYDRNQLKTADDSGDLALGFYDGTDAEIEYHYDHNGNMDVDDNKGFVFAYNYLNLPKEIVGGNNTVRYIYDANGVKLSKELVQNGAISYTDYVGNFVYKDGDLDYISTSEGRITEPTAGTIQYEYFLKDHLGNTRTVFADGNSDGVIDITEILQETHYYPYGMSIGDLAIDRGADNKLKYNGKELQDDVLNGVKLSLYAYGARYYMDDVPVFTTIDPLTEKFSSWSPYNYCFNNPIRYTDPDGMNPYDEILNGALEQLGVQQGYEVSHNNETGVTTIIHTRVGQHPEKSSPIGSGEANFQMTTTTFTVGSDGGLSEVSVNTTGLNVSVSSEEGAWGSTNYSVDGIETTNEGYSFANEDHNSDQLDSYSKDPIVSGVSAIKQNFGNDALSSQDFNLSGLKSWDRLQTAMPNIIKGASLLGKNTQTIGVEDAVNWDKDNHTWLSIPQNKVEKAAERLQKLSRQTPVIIN